MKWIPKYAVPYMWVLLVIVLVVGLKALVFLMPVTSEKQTIISNSPADVESGQQLLTTPPDTVMAVEELPVGQPAVALSDTSDSVELTTAHPWPTEDCDDPRSDDDPYLIVDPMPRFQGGDLLKFHAWVISRLKYPEEAIEQHIEGRVALSFVIDRDGSVTDIIEIYSSHPKLTRAVIETLKTSPKWTPGKLDGKVVRVKHALPFDFRMPSSTPVSPTDNKPSTAISRLPYVSP